MHAVGKEGAGEVWVCCVLRGLNSCLLFCEFSLTESISIFGWFAHIQWICSCGNPKFLVWSCVCARRVMTSLYVSSRQIQTWNLNPVPTDHKYLGKVPASIIPRPGTSQAFLTTSSFAGSLTFSNSFFWGRYKPLQGSRFQLPTYLGPRFYLFYPLW